MFEDHPLKSFLQSLLHKALLRLSVTYIHVAELRIVDENMRGRSNLRIAVFQEIISPFDLISLKFHKRKRSRIRHIIWSGVMWVYVCGEGGGAVRNHSLNAFLQIKPKLIIYGKQLVQ